MSEVGVEGLNLWSREAMLTYLIILVFGLLITSHVMEAIFTILDRAEINERQQAYARLRRSTRRYKELTDGARKKEAAQEGGGASETTRYSGSDGREGVCRGPSAHLRHQAHQLAA